MNLFGQSRLTKIVVKTGLAKKAGMRLLPQDLVEPDNVLKRVLESQSEYIAVIPDIGYLFADLILPKALEKLRNADVVVIIAKPMSVLHKLLKVIGSLPILEKLTGHPRGYILLFKKSLVEQYDGSSKELVDIVMSNANRVVEFTYDIPLVYYLIHVYSKLPYPILLAVREPIRILKYAFVGLLGSIINLVVVSLVAEQVGVAPGKFFQLVIPGLAGFEASTVFNFLLHETWTFSDMNLSHRITDVVKRFFKYHIACIASLFMQVSCILVLTGFFAWSITASAFTGILLGFIGNYILGRLFTWSPYEE